MKKITLKYVGQAEQWGSDLYLEDKNLADILKSTMDEQGEPPLKGLVRLTMTIEPLEDAGLTVEVE
nr:hypothetical protein [uncultured Gemmiger sp.]